MSLNKHTLTDYWSEHYAHQQTQDSSRPAINSKVPLKIIVLIKIKIPEPNK